MKKFLKIFFVLVIILTVGYIGLNVFVSNRVKSLLNDQTEKGNLTYQRFSHNWINPSFRLDSVVFRKGNNHISLNHITATGLKYTDYLFRNTLSVDEIIISQPQLTLIKTKKDSVPSTNSNLEQSIRIGQITIQKAGLTYQTDSLQMIALKNYDINIQGITVDTTSIKNQIPFNHTSIVVNGGKLSCSLSNIQTLELDSLIIDKNDINIHELAVKPKYSQKDYVKFIPYEMDLMDVNFKQITLSDYQIDSQERMFFSSKNMKIDSVNAEIYRNKMVRDDLSKKKMYSQMLRDLPFDLQIDTLQLSKVNLSYEEVQEKTGETGLVFFKNMEATISDITNRNMNRDDFPKTIAQIQTQFMGASPLSVEWSFHINNPDDTFRITGESHRIPPKFINTFLQPAFNMQAEGTGIKDLYFNFSGNRYTANGNIKMVYDDLKIKVLKNDNKKSVNKLVTFVANLFVKSENKARENDVEVEKVERDPTKSFWNYFWNCIMEGLKKTVI